MPVSASFGKTWDAVIDVFAVRNIPIRTLERVSGLIAAEPASVEGFDPRKEHPWADCGTVDVGGRNGRTFTQPASAFYNVRVKGDSARSSVLVTINWKHYATIGKERTLVECATRSVWETQLAEEIKTRAEADRGLSDAPQRSDASGLQPSATAIIGAPTSESDRAAAVREFAQGKSYIGNHDWAKAEKSLRDALRHDGSVAEYHAALGSLMMTLKRWDEAEAEFGAATLLDIDNPEYQRMYKTARSKR
jgi:hypothetical protein